jgi:lipoprotein-releasing system permease protein
MKYFEYFLARRYLKIRHEHKLVPLVTILAALGVAVGVMVLVVVIAVMTGFQNELKKRMLGIESHIVVMRYNQWVADHKEIADRIERVQGVQSAAPFIYSQGILRSSQDVAGVILRGIDPLDTAVHVPTGKGRNLSEMLQMEDSASAVPGIVIGSVLADKLQVKSGDGLLLMIAESRGGSPSQLPRMHRLEVAGVFETGMHQYDGTMGFLPIGQLQQMLAVSDKVTGLDIRVQNVDDVEAITQKILSSLGMEYWASNWKQMHRNLFSMLVLQKIVMFVILTLIIIVAAFNIASALIMMVKEKTREISILKAMGASQRSVQKIFLLKGIVIGLSGIFMGLCAGLALCFLLMQYNFIELPGDVYFLTSLPVEINMLDIGYIILGTMIICIGASIYPAKQASKMDPVDGIRYG